jgi:two-component system chemotaxis response regulator CheB
MTHIPSHAALGTPSPSKPLLAGANQPGGHIRTLVVDDSVVIRRLISRMLSSDPQIEVVGSARDGHDALVKIEELQPDLVTLDVEMPEMNGLEALRLMQVRFPKVRVIMCSSLTERGAAITIDALLAGASDYVCKQHSSELSESAYESLRIDLLAKIRYVFARAYVASAPPSRSQAGGGLQGAGLAAAGLAAQQTLAPQAPALPRSFKSTRISPKILAVGVSTGGPSALAEILPLIPSDFSLPIVIVQHMPPFFTQLLAERLSRLSSIPVLEATQGMQLRAGVAVIAPGNFHMRLIRKLDGRIEVDLNQEAQENSCRPAVDVLFRSVAEIYGGAAIAVILTGMGQDGLLGVRALKGLGASVLVQDSSSSVVWGMPGAVAGANLADLVLPLKDIIPQVLRLI